MEGETLGKGSGSGPTVLEHVCLARGLATDSLSFSLSQTSVATLVSPISGWSVHGNAVEGTVHYNEKVCKIRVKELCFCLV